MSPPILPARAPFPTFLISFAVMVVLATALPIPHLVPFAPSGWLEANSVDGGGNRVDRVRESVSVAALALIVGITPGRLASRTMQSCAAGTMGWFGPKARLGGSIEEQEGFRLRMKGVWSDG